jgi:hypothetical protein
MKRAAVGRSQRSLDGSADFVTLVGFDEQVVTPSPQNLGPEVFVGARRTDDDASGNIGVDKVAQNIAPVAVRE